MDSEKKKKILTYKDLIEKGLDNIKISNFEKATLYFTEAINTEKTSYEAYINLSNIYIYQNKIKKSLDLLNNYFLNYPYNFLLSCHLADIYFNYGYEEDLLKFDKVLEEKNNFNNKDKYYIYFLQAKFFEKKNKTEIAIDLFNKAIKINKLHFQSFISLLNLYESTNNLKNFVAYLNNAKKIFINAEEKKVLLFYESLLLNRQKKYNESENFIQNHKLVSLFRDNKSYLIRLFNLKSKNNEKLKNYKNAFDSVSLRNDLLLNLESNKNFNKHSVLNTINTYKNFYLKNKDKFLFDSDKKIKSSKNAFLVGFPRSGTTLLDTVLRSHKLTLVLEEEPYLLNCRKSFFNNNKDLNSLIDISKAEKDIIKKQYYSQINIKENNLEKIIIDKFPLSIIELPFIKINFPDSKIIFALRHPCDVIISCYFTYFKINDAMLNFLKVEDIIHFYNEVFELFDIYNKKLNIKVHFIKYEDVINDFDKTIENLTQYLDIDFQPDMRNFFLTARNREKISTPSYQQVINPIYKSSINKWKHYDKILELENKMQKWITYFGY